MKIPKDYVLQSEAMKMLGVDYEELQRLKRNGTLKVYDKGPPVYISLESIQKVSESRRHKPESY